MTTNPEQKLNPCPVCGEKCRRERFEVPSKQEQGVIHIVFAIICSQSTCEYAAAGGTPQEAIQLHNSIKPPCVWREEFPTEQCYWWWIANPEAAPVIVSIFWSGTDNSYFAHQGQLGWKEHRPAKWFEEHYPDSLWMKVDEPVRPNCGGQIEVKGEK